MITTENVAKYIEDEGVTPQDFFLFPYGTIISYLDTLGVDTLRIGEVKDVMVAFQNYFDRLLDEYKVDCKC